MLPGHDIGFDDHANQHAFDHYAAGAATAASGLAIALSIHDLATGPGRFVVVCFLFLTPTFALVRLVPSAHTVHAVVVGAAGSVSINALVAQLMLSAGWWSHSTGVIIVSSITTVLWLLPSTRPAPTVGRMSPKDTK